MCEYKFRNGRKCEEEAFENSEYCILHIDLPEDEGSEEFKRINEFKKKKVNEKINKGDSKFQGAKLFEVNFFGRNIIKTHPDCLNFEDADIRGNVSFYGININRHLWLEGSKIGGYFSFSEGKIGQTAFFDGARIHKFVRFSNAEINWVSSVNNSQNVTLSFTGAEIGGDVDVSESKILGAATFNNVQIGGGIRVSGSEIRGDVCFTDAKIGGRLRYFTGVSFSGSEIGGDVDFDRTEINSSFANFNLVKIEGRLSFKDTKFKSPRAQEEACRKAKTIHEELGNREEADYYFYREMEARRKQKHIYFSLTPILKIINKVKLEKRLPEFILNFLKKQRKIYWGFLELPIQYIFGYGTYWWGVLILWFSVVFGCAFLYWYGDAVVGASSFQECIYFSIVTITTLGYGDYEPVKGIYQLLAASEAVFGTFMWAAFIAIFARKYMR